MSALKGDLKKPIRPAVVPGTFSPEDPRPEPKWRCAFCETINTVGPSCPVCGNPHTDMAVEPPKPDPGPTPEPPVKSGSPVIPIIIGVIVVVIMIILAVNAQACEDTDAAVSMPETVMTDDGQNPYAPPDSSDTVVIEYDQTASPA